MSSLAQTSSRDHVLERSRARVAKQAKTSRVATSTFSAVASRCSAESTTETTLPDFVSRTRLLRVVSLSHETPRSDASRIDTRSGRSGVLTAKTVRPLDSDARLSRELWPRARPRWPSSGRAHRDSERDRDRATGRVISENCDAGVETPNDHKRRGGHRDMVPHLTAIPWYEWMPLGAASSTR